MIPSRPPDNLLDLAASNEGRRWLADLPRLIDELTTGWELDLEQSCPGASVSYVALARQHDREVVMKIQWPHDECLHEADALRAWSGSGAVRLLAHDPARHALLLERCTPGTTLANSECDDTTVIVIELLPRLWIPAGSPFGTLETEATCWRDGLYDNWREAGYPLERELIDLADRYLEELSGSQGEQVLVHQDLHGDNILAATREPWLAIDPKPLLGEREFALAPLVRSSELGHSRGAVIGRLDRLSAGLGLDRERARRWTIAQTVAWSLDAGSSREHLEAVRWLDDDAKNG